MKVVSSREVSFGLRDCGESRQGRDSERTEPEILARDDDSVRPSALVRLSPVDEAPPAPIRLQPPAAAFLAQLIATAQQVPQTRMRRRAEPAEAVSKYAAAKKLDARAPDWNGFTA
jgi:hypothetical protein